MLNRELKRVIAGVSMVTLIVIIVFVALAVMLTTRYDGTHPAYAEGTNVTQTPTPTPYYAPTPNDKTTRTIKYNGTEVTGAMAIVFDSNKTTWEDYNFSRYSPVDHDTYYQWNGSQMAPTGTPPVDSSWTETWSPSAPPTSPASVNLTASWEDDDNPSGGNDTPTPPGALGPTTAGAPFTISLVNVAGITPQVTQGSGSWVGNTFYVSAGSTVQFQANPNPTGATWPSGKPAWGGAASGTGSTASVTFSSAGNTTVTCECDNTAKLGVAVVGVAGLQWSETGNDPWTNVSATTQYVPVGATRYFKAVSDPTGATWPSGKPVWSGSSGVSGTGETKSVTFGAVSSNSTDYKTVVAECGTTAGVSVVVVGLSALQWRESSNDPWTTLTVTTQNLPLGGTRQFKALPNPAGATWPTDKPAWSGSSGASGTGETVSVTFDTTSTSAADFKTVNCECGNTVTLNAVVVGLKATQWSATGNDPWTTITTTALYVPMNATRHFRALPGPFDATWPLGNPVWNVDGITTGTGSSKTISFYNTPPTPRTVAVGCGGTTFTRQVYTVKFGFAQSAAQVCSLDDFTTQPVAGPWKLIACSGTDYVDAVTTPSAGAPHVYFASSTTSTLTVSPTQAGSSPQQLTLHCNTSTSGTVQVHARLDGINGYNLSTLNVIAYTTRTLSVAFRVIDEENDDVQVIGLGGGGGTPNQICVSAGTNGFRDTGTLGGDDQISGTNILTGQDGICQTTANNQNLHSTCPYTATALKNYLRTVYLPALVDATTVTQLATMAVNYDLNCDANVDTTSWTTQEMNVIINNCSDTDYDRIIFLVDDGSYPRGLGFMDYGSKHGFVHANLCQQYNCNAFQVTAHELGHGTFRFLHTIVTEGYAYNDPLNLMWPFADGAPTKLRKDQWDIIHP